MATNLPNPIQTVTQPVSTNAIWISGGGGGFGQVHVQSAQAALTKEQEESRKIIEALIEMLDEADMDFVINAATQRKYAKASQYTSVTTLAGTPNWWYQQYQGIGQSPLNTGGPQQLVSQQAVPAAQPQGISLWQALFGHP